MINAPLIKTKPILAISLSGVMMALVYVSTMFLKVPIGPGYIHLGNLVIFLVSIFLTWDVIFFAGFGMVIADLSSGYALYAPFTLMFVLLWTLIFLVKSKDNLINFLIKSWFVLVSCLAMYFLADSILYGPEAGIPYLGWNSLQAGVGIAAGIFIYVTKANQTFKIKK